MVLTITCIIWWQIISSGNIVKNLFFKISLQIIILTCSKWCSDKNNIILFSNRLLRVNMGYVFFNIIIRKFISSNLSPFFFYLFFTSLFSTPCIQAFHDSLYFCPFSSFLYCFAHYSFPVNHNKTLKNDFCNFIVILIFDNDINPLIQPGQVTGNGNQIIIRGNTLVCSATKWNDPYNWKLGYFIFPWVHVK